MTQERTRFEYVLNPDDYSPVQEAYVQKKIPDTLSKPAHRTDREMHRYEEYLRAKWGCADDIPDAFDPEKLEAALNKRFGGKRKLEKPSVEREEIQEVVEGKPGDQKPIVSTAAQNMTNFGSKAAPAPEGMYVSGRNAPSDLECETPATESLDTAEQSEMSESDTEHEAPANDTLAGVITAARSASKPKTARSHRGSATETPARPPTPRIRAGSKPPLSPSAFVDGGVPCLDEKCRGACKQAKAKGRAKTPRYFPFRSGMKA